MNSVYELIEKGDLEGLRKLHEAGEYLPDAKAPVSEEEFSDDEFADDEFAPPSLSPLFTAVSLGHTHIVSWWLEQYPNCIQEVGRHGYNLLHQAIIGGHLDLVKWLIEKKGFNPQTTDSYSNTALLLAALYGKVSIVDWLLKNKHSTLNEKDIGGDTAFLNAISNNHYDCADYLLNAGVSIEQTNNHGNTALLMSASKGDAETISWLANKGAAISHTNADGDTAFALAAKADELDAMEALLAHGATLNTRNKKGDSPLLIAAAEGNLDVIEFLLKQGASLNEVNHQGETALLIAVKKRDIDTVKGLLALGASLNDRDKYGNTALILATINRDHEMVDFILNYAKSAQSTFDLITAKNKYQMMALNFALKDRHLAERYCSVLKIDLDEYKHRDRLFYAFGGGKLNDVLKYPNLPIQYGLGNYREGLQDLNHYLQGFAKTQPDHIQRELNRIANIVEHSVQAQNLEIDDVLNKIDHGETLFLETGFTGHLINAAIEKANDQGDMRLTLSERGAFMNKNEGEKAGSVKTLVVSRELRAEVLHLLQTARSSDPNKAKEILYTTIPQLVKSNYENKVMQKHFKGNICFWSNPKTGVYDQMVKTLGFNQAKMVYKQFELFIRENEVNKYKKYLTKKYPNCNPDENPIVVECMKIIQDRRGQVQSLVADSVADVSLSTGKKPTI